MIDCSVIVRPLIICSMEVRLVMARLVMARLVMARLVMVRSVIVRLERAGGEISRATMDRRVMIQPVIVCSIMERAVIVRPLAASRHWLHREFEAARRIEYSAFRVTAVRELATARWRNAGSLHRHLF